MYAPVSIILFDSPNGILAIMERNSIGQKWPNSSYAASDSKYFKYCGVTYDLWYLFLFIFYLLNTL